MMSIANLLAAICSIFLLAGCNKLVEVGPPPERISGDEAYETDGAASNSVWGIYTEISKATNLLYGASSVYSAIYSDEMTFESAQPDLKQFAASAIDPANKTMRYSFWTQPYSLIYLTNRALEGLQNNWDLSPALRSQLFGEAYFLRALIYFHLIQYFKEVPLVDVTNYKISRNEPRKAIPSLLAFILGDLKNAKNLLNNAYPSSEKVRANKFAAAALLARYYLYTADWVYAEREATEIIQSGVYQLEALDSVFLAGSKEAIFQLYPPADRLSMEGYLMLPPTSFRPAYALSHTLVTSFEPGDKRWDAWTKKYTSLGATFYYPFKYKVRTPDLLVTGQAKEYSTLIRLGEIYLIRAEARARQGNLSAAILDLNVIRDRAGLPLIDPTDHNLTSDDVLSLVEHERQIELFAECGHRFFDLKRTSKASAVLGSIKQDWTDHALLWPIPETQLKLNTNLTQNPGYRR